MARRNLLLGVTLLLGLGLAVLLMAAPAGTLPAALAQGPDSNNAYYVAPDGLCGGQSPCYSTVQAAVDAADDVADTVLVAGGTYTGLNSYASYSQTLYISETVTVRGGYTTTNWTTSDPVANPTTLDAEGQGRVVYIQGSSITPTLESLRFTGGSAAALGGRGGGVYIDQAPATISNCVVFSNSASMSALGYGGGLYVHQSAASLTGNTVWDNVASWNSGGKGGGIYLNDSSATLTGNTIGENTGSWGSNGDGGGIYLYNGSATLTGNTISENTGSWGSYGDGGGLFLWKGNGITLAGNTLRDNWASAGGSGTGGGLYAYLPGSTEVTGNIIRGNVASTISTGSGGGVYFSSRSILTMTDNTIISNTATLNGSASGKGGGVGILEVSSLNLTNNIVAGNQANAQGSGLWCEGTSAYPISGLLLHNTMADNSTTGGSQQGIFIGAYASLAFTNTIISGHAGTGITVTSGSTATLEATLWYNNGSDTGGSGTITTGTLNLNASPAFVDASALDYHLSAASAAMDVGLNAGVVTDVDGDARPAGSGYDLGADEYAYGLLFVPDRLASTQPGRVITYTHTLTNTGNETDTFDLTYDGDHSWPVSFDSPIVLASGVSTTVLVAITVPQGIVSGTVDTTVVTATSQADSDFSSAVTDTTTVTQLAMVELAPDRAGITEPGTTITYSHVLTNTGNSSDTFDLSHVSDWGWVVAYDTPITLADGLTATVVVSVSVPGGTVSDTVDSTVVAATSQVDGGVSALVTDTTTVGQVPGLELEPDNRAATKPGRTITYAHILTNTGNGPDVFDLSHDNEHSWTVLYDEPVSVGWGMTATVVMSVRVPSGIFSGTLDTTVLTASSQANPAVTASATDTMTVIQMAMVELAPDRAGTAAPGTTITYSHILTNSGNFQDIFDLTYTSSADWVVSAPPVTLTLAAWQTETVTVAVGIDSLAISGTVDTTVITARSRAEPAVSDPVTDTTTVQRVVAVQFEADEAEGGLPDEEIIYSHVLTNNGNYPDRFTLTSDSSEDWDVDLADWVDIPAWQTATVIVTVTIPSDAISDTMDTTVVTATSVADTSELASVSDTTTVQRTVAVQFKADESASGVPDEVVTYTHVLTNDGNYPDRFTLTSASSAVWGVEHVPWVDVAAWQTATVVVSVTIPVDAISSTVDTTVVTAASQANSTVTEFVVDTTTVLRVVDLDLAPSNSTNADPGTVAVFTHTLTNHGNYTDTFTLIHSSSQNWSVEHEPLITLADWQSATIAVSVTLPQDVVSGTVDATLILAISHAKLSATSSAWDTTRVNLVTGVALAPDRAADAGPGQQVTYSHVLTNNGSSTETFTITIGTSQGWTVDHAPSLTVGPWQTATLEVTVGVPPGIISGTLDTTLVTATLSSDPGVSATVTDTTTVIQAPGAELAPDHEQVTNPGATVVYTHVLTNTGNYTDTFDLTFDSSQSWIVASRPVSVHLGIGLSETVVVTLQVPSLTLSNTLDLTVITATSQADPAVLAVATDRTGVGRVFGLAFAPDRASSGLPGQVVTYSHVLTNLGSYTETYDITTASSPEWNAGHVPWLEVGAWQTATLVVSVTVPPTAISSTVGATLITATLQADPGISATVTDATTVVQVVGADLSPGHLGLVPPGATVVYSHVLTNTGNYADLFDLAYGSSRDWLLASRPSSVLLGIGLSETVVVTIGVPSIAVSDTVDLTVITATSRSDPSFSVTVTDTTLVGQVVGVGLAPDRASDALPGEPVTYTHVLTNHGSHSQVYDIDGVSDKNWDVDHVPWLELGAWQTATVVVTITVPPGALCDVVDTTLVTAALRANPTVSATVTDTTTVLQVSRAEFTPDHDAVVRPGATIVYSHVLTNTGNHADTLNLNYASSPGWVTAMRPVSAALGVGLTGTVVITVEVPGTVISGTLDVTVITATSRADPGFSVSVTDTTAAGRIERVELAPDCSASAKPGVPVLCSHTLTNTGNGTDVFYINHSNDVGSVVDYDTPILLAKGQTTTLEVEIILPPGTLSGTVDTIVITATSSGDPSVFASVTETVTTTKTIGVDLVPDRYGLADSGATKVYTHTLTNTGNDDDIFGIWGDSTQGWAVDYDQPIALGPGASHTLVVSISVPPDTAAGTLDSTLLVAFSSADPGTSSTVRDTTRVNQVGGLQFTPDRQDSGLPGGVLTYSHTLTNTGNSQDSFDLSHDSDQGWAVVHPLSVTLDVSETASLIVSITIPLDAISGTLDTTVLTATSRADGTAAAVFDRTEVNRVVDLSLVPDQSQQVGPGVPVVYNHVLTNTGNFTDTYDLSYTSDLGWIEGIPLASVELDPGVSATVAVTIAVPAKAFSGTIDTLTITATSQASPTLLATASETTTVIRVVQVTLEPDSARSVNPAETVTYTHVLTNGGNYTDTFDLEYDSSQDWVVTAPPASIVLTAWQTVTLEILLQVGSEAISDTVDSTVLTATSQANPAIHDLAVDTTTVVQVPRVQFVPDRLGSGQSGELVAYTHTITNTGNGPDTYDLTHRSSLGWSVGYTSPVALADGQSTTIIVSLTLPLDAFSGTVDTTLITVTSQAQAAVFAVVTDTTGVDRLIDLVLAPDHARSVYPAETIVYTHVLTNTGNYTDTFDLVYLSSQDWIVGTPPPSIELPPGESEEIVVQISVPAATLSGVVDTLVITATARADSGFFGRVTDLTTVANAPDLAFEPDLAGGVDAGSFTTYNHTLTNLGNLLDTFDLGLASSQGWAVLAPSTPVQLDPGESVQVVVTVTVPADAVSGTVDTTVVTAASQTDPSIGGEVTDTTTAGQVPRVSLTPNSAGTGLPGTIVAYDHTLVNTGNGLDTFVLTHESSQGWDVDYDTPITLGPGDSTTVVVSITVPANTAPGVVDHTTITAISRADGRVDDTASDTTTVGLLSAVELLPDYSLEAEPGATVAYQHTLTNKGHGTDTYDLLLSSSQGWASVAPASPITLVPGEEAIVTVTVNVPSDVGDGMVDTTEVVAQSQTVATVFDGVTDETTVSGGVYHVYLPMAIR